MNPYILFYILVFIIGASIGSFINCLVYRLEKGKGFVKGSSYCPKCKHQLKWLDLVPLLSFLALRGKCRYCKEKISWRYPLIEIAIGVLFLLIFNFQFSVSIEFSIFNFQTILQLLYLWAIASALMIVFLFDLKTYLIPDKIVYPAIGLVLVYQAIIDYHTLPSILLAGLGAAGFFFIIWAMGRGKWMGFGDVQLALLMGLFLGWPNILVALFSSFFLGSIIGITLMILGHKKMKSQVPFGPFLVVGTFLALFWGDKIVNWYLNLML